VHQTAFRIGDMDIAWYGICLAVGFMLGLWTAGRRGMRIGLNAEDISNLMIWMFIGGVVGGKALFLINHWEEFQNSKNSMQMLRSGWVFHGSLIGACIGIWIFIRRKGMPLWATFDALAPSFALGHAIGRIGCFMNGCCFGKTCELPWAVQFPAGTMPHSHHLSIEIIEPTAKLSAFVHPSQMYEFILNIMFYAFLAWLFRRRKFDGQIFAAYLLGYAVIRFGIEFARADDRGWLWFSSLTSGQGISILLLGLGAFIWWKLKDQPMPDLEDKSEKPEEA
jgi:phosphatidylglycerol:prolipoprotein diacylglycerol transferase|tara:strand:+ start:280 stop:1116 length:837 start_codon:yes stop_codon:yes gene_type:complete